MIDAYPSHDLSEKLGDLDDLSVGSPQLQSLIDSGTDAFHLSPQRADLLRPVRHLLSLSVLELGAGCGPITRFLGEHAQRVVALEPNVESARVARARCADQPHVRIVRQLPQTSAGPERFAAVVCVGPRGPLPELLAQAAQHLAPGGTLLLALENQLGLKYLAGASDDRTALPFHGIHDSYAPAQPQPLGRAALTRLLREAGFASTAFLLPFPDWQHPQVIMTPEGARTVGPLMANLLRRAAPDRAATTVRSFSEELTWPLVHTNGLTGDLANAFLVLARRDGDACACIDADALAYCYSTAGRPRNFAKETVLRGPASAARVERRRLYPLLEPRVGDLMQVLVDEPASAGELYIHGLTERLNRPKWGVQDLVDWVKPWADYLAAQQLPGTVQEPHVDGQLVDCVPFNLLQQADGSLVAFDLEWQLDHPIPSLWVLMRGLLYSLARAHSTQRPQPGTPHNLLQLTCQTLNALGWPADDAAVASLLAHEARYFGFPADTLRQWHLTLRSQGSREGMPLPAGYPAPADSLETLRHQVATLKNRLARALAHGAAGQRPRLPQLTPRRLAAAAQRLLGGSARPAGRWGREWVRPFIDAEYYLSHYMDVADAGSDPVLHYLDWGAHEGRNPNDWFDTRFYVRTNPDVARSGINPLVHYVLFGWREGRPTQTMQVSPGDAS